MDQIKDRVVNTAELGQAVLDPSAKKRRGAAAKQPANEIEAMNQCYLALKPLRLEQRKRVMQAVMVMLGAPAEA